MIDRNQMIRDLELLAADSRVDGGCVTELFPEYGDAIDALIAENEKLIAWVKRTASDTAGGRVCYDMRRVRLEAKLLLKEIEP